MSGKEEIMAMTISSANEKKKEIVKNLAWVGIYLTFLLLAGVEFKQRYDWPHTWWYSFALSLVETLAILFVCQLLRRYSRLSYFEEYKKYLKLCVLSRVASSVSVVLLVYSTLVVTLELKILGTAFTALLLIMLFLKFINYLKGAYKTLFDI